MGGTFEIHNVGMAKQALATVKNFHLNGEKAITLLVALLGSPESATQTQSINGGTVSMANSGSPVHGEVFATLVELDPVLSWKIGFDLYQTKSLEPYYFSKAIQKVITPEYLSQIDPAQIQKLLKSNPGLAKDIARAFWQMSDHQTKDPRAIPWLGECLSNSDVEVQYFGMMGLYEVCGKKEHFPTAFIARFKTDPPKYLAAYQTWWARHRAEYVPVSQ